MMKRFPTLLILFCAPFILLAQQDEKAKKVLDELSEKNKQFETIEAEFKSSMVDTKNDLNESQEGNLKLKGDKYVIDLGDQKVISNGKTRWTYLKNDNEVHIDDVSEEEGSDEMIKPSEIFTIWESGFKYEYVELKNMDGSQFHIIKLYPKDPGGKSYHTIQLTIDKQKKSISEVRVFGKYGTDYIYEVKHLETGKEYKDSMFTFNEKDHPGVEKVDLR